MSFTGSCARSIASHLRVLDCNSYVSAGKSEPLSCNTRWEHPGEVPMSSLIDWLDIHDGGRAKSHCA